MYDSRAFPTAPLDPRAHSILMQAKDYSGRATSESPFEVVLEKERRRAAELSSYPRAQMSPDKVQELATANAIVAALLSTAVDFPRFSSPPGLIYVANTLANVHDLYLFDRDADKALEAIYRALALARSYRAIIGAPNLGPTIYSLTARAAESAGIVAANRRATPEQLIQSFDFNITEPNAPLMSQGDLSGPRAFSFVFMLRSAAEYPVTPEARQYLGFLLEQAPQLRSLLRPNSSGAARTYEGMLDVEIERGRAWLAAEAPGGFRWAGG